MSSKNFQLALAAGAAIAALGMIYLWRRSSKKTLALPVIDFSKYLSKDSPEEAKEAYEKECKKVAEALHTYGE